MVIYKSNQNAFGTAYSSVNKEVNGVTICCIPFDPANTDAVEFAKWMKEGNKPEPAVEGEVVTDEWVSETIAKLLPNG